MAPPPLRRVDPYAPRAPAEPRFRAWPALNQPHHLRAVRPGARSRLALDDSASGRALAALFGDADTLQARFARALAARKALDRKEFFECFETRAYARSSLRPTEPILCDVAGGNGLTAALFALFESRRFSQVVVMDPNKPPSWAAVVDALDEVAPWAAAKLSYLEEPLDGQTSLPAGCAVICVHGCGSLTDAVISSAASSRAASIALMPCCYASCVGALRAPEVLRRQLGVSAAADIQRTYELERHGFHVNWRTIPSSVTPMNRLILARRSTAISAAVVSAAPRS